MEMKAVICVLFMCFSNIYYIEALSFPGPRVYVVTPAARPLEKDDGKFYYHKWMRRMDQDLNTTTTTTTETSKIKTPDLIFAEFESNGNMQKSIRKLLEKEQVSSKLSTMGPIYVPDDDENKVTRVVNYGLPVKIEKHEEDKIPSDIADFSYNNDNFYNKLPAPVYSNIPTKNEKNSTTTTTTESLPVNIENVWHIIDNEKINQYSGNWHEVSTNNNEKNIKDNKVDNSDSENIKTTEDNKKQEGLKHFDVIDDNFALPGFATNSGNNAENESRAIRTDPIIRIPYVNIKPFQIKSYKKTSQNNLSNMNINNILSSLDNFSDLKHPVRGEAQDILPLESQIDRYNPAQPYLPQPTYGSKVSKQSNLVSPTKSTANLVPPPPPPSKASEDFPTPVSYESFPPYLPGSSKPDFGSPPPSDTIGSQVLDTPGGDEPSYDSDSRPMDLGYHYKSPTGMADSPIKNMGYDYKAPSPPISQFFPTVAPAPKPFAGYSYNKPSMDTDGSAMSVADKPEYEGYHYNKPETAKPTHDLIVPSYDSPQSYGMSSNYGHDLSPTIHDHDSEYPELDFKKPHDHGNEVVKSHDMGMMPPPPPPPPEMNPSMYGPPLDDHGFPSDFPTDFKFHHDFDEDHDHYHDHYHHPTTTTTEMPRVNRFSYYYLGKKLYYLPLYFSVYFIVYVGALIIKAVLRHKIVYPNSWRPNTTTATFFSKRSVDEYLSNDNLHKITNRVTHALATAAEKYMNNKKES